MGKPKLVDAAPAAVFRKRRLGGPWVTVRAHYGALPSVAGRGWSERAKALGIMAKASPRPGSTVPGTKKSPQVERRTGVAVCVFPRKHAAACYTAPFGAPLPLTKGEAN